MDPDILPQAGNGGQPDEEPAPATPLFTSRTEFHRYLFVITGHSRFP